MELDRHGIGVHYSSSLALNIESEHLDNVLSQLDRHNHALDKARRIAANIARTDADLAERKGRRIGGLKVSPE